MRFRRGAGVLLLLLAGLGACDRQDPQGTAGDGRWRGKVTLTGSSTIAPLAAEVGKAFEAAHPGVRIDVQTGGSSRGIADTRRGIADIGMASRALGAEETDLTAHTIAMDGVAMILHRDNPVAALTDEQVAGIYTGRITRWSEVGGPDAPITVVNKAEGRATLEVFLAYVGLRSPEIRADVVIGDNEQGIRTVAGDPNAIGYVSIGTADAATARGAPIRVLAASGVAPTIANVRSGTFPMSRPLNLVTHGPGTRLAQAFIAYAGSPEVHDLVTALHLVPLAD